MTAAFRAAIARLDGGFSSVDVSSLALKAHPELKDKIANGASVTMKFLVKLGEVQMVRRQGMCFIYRKAKSGAELLESIHQEIAEGKAAA